MASWSEEVFLRFRELLKNIGTRHPNEQKYIDSSYDFIYKVMMAKKEVSVV